MKKPTVELTEFEFLGQVLVGKIGKAKGRVLKRSGAFIRRSARQSMKKRPKKPKTRFGEFKTVKRGRNIGKKRFVKGESSPPGKPPLVTSTSKGARNLRSIRFEVSGDANSLVIHTIPFRSSQSISQPPAALHEAGGTASIRRKPRRSKRGRRIIAKAKTVAFPARPYMAPAGSKGLKDFRKKFKNSIR